MTLRRLFVGVLVLFILSFWCWVRPGGKQAHAKTAEAKFTQAVDDEAVGGNHDDQEHRFRTGQSRHWRNVMLGTR